MAIQNIGHLYIETKSFSDALAFWEGLGFRLVAEWGERGHKAGRLEAGQTYIILVEDETPEVTVHFHVQDIEKYAEQLRSIPAVTFQFPVERTHWGSLWTRVQDPDGHVFALEQKPEGKEGGSIMVFDVLSASLEEPHKESKSERDNPVVVDWSSVRTQSAQEHTSS